MTPAVVMEGLSRRFSSVTAVDGLSLTVAEGELFGLVGSDGAGKTTTLRMLASVLDPSGGSATVLGRDSVREAEEIRPHIGYMSQRFGLYPDLTVDENIRFYADIFGLSRCDREGRTEDLLAFSRLAPFRRRRAGDLSGGMKQKLGLACALIHTPRLLLLDEPTNGVDPLSRRDFWDILHDLLRKGVTIIVATAYLDEAERCGRIALMHEGRVLGCDTPGRLKSSFPGKIVEIRPPETRRAFLHLRKALPHLPCTLFGDRIHAVADDPRPVVQALEPLFPGITGAVVEPTLEDVVVRALEAGT